MGKILGEMTKLLAAFLAGAVCGAAAVIVTREPARSSEVPEGYEEAIQLWREEAKAELAREREKPR